MSAKALSPYKQVPETKADLDWAELCTLDLSQFDTADGKRALTEQLTYAAQHVGFFYVKNFGISQEEVDEQFALGSEFYSLPLEEKLKYHSLQDLHSGDYNGYQPAGLKKRTETIRDNIQIYNMPKFDGHHNRTHPAVLQDHIQKIEAFSRKCHELVVVKLLKLFAIMLELPDEDQLANYHVYDVKGEDHLRYMHYKARPAEENRQVGQLYSKGHTDLGSLTLLFRQPVAGLQIQNSKGEWKWVKPQDETITINICDSLSALTGGYLKSSVHRVHAPPEDQAHIDRIGVLYFSRTNNHIVLDPVSNSPLLQRLGLTKNQFTELGHHLTAEQWVKLRQTQQQRPTEVPKIDGSKWAYKTEELQIIPGLTAKYFD